MEAREYYEKITGAPIAELARDLVGDRITETNETTLFVDCPNHSSSSGKSLHVDLGGNRFYCFGCGEGGDALHFVEFVKTGRVSKGEVNDGHRDARDYIAGKVGLPSLGKACRSADELREIETRRAEEDRVFGALTAATEVYHEGLLRNEEALSWLRESYGFDREIIERFRIGWVSGRTDLVELKSRGVKVEDLVAAGLFYPPDDSGNAGSFFLERIVFPYMSRGRTVYMIGRDVPKELRPTRKGDRGAKYTKLPVRKDDRNEHVSTVIVNSVLWNEDDLDDPKGELVVAEGITDAIATKARGFRVVSPVTVRLKKTDLLRVKPKLKGFDSVVFVLDNEWSEVGLRGALETARALQEETVRPLVGVIPPDDAQVQAREAIAELLGPENVESIRWAKGDRVRKELIEKALPNEPDRQRFDRLQGEAKIDLALWWKSGGTVDDFRAILASSLEPIEVVIDRAPVIADDTPRQLNALADVLTEVGLIRASMRGRYLSRLRERGVEVSKKDLEAEAMHRAKRARKKERESFDPSSVAQGADSLARLIKAIRDGYLAIEEPVDWEEIGRQAFEWITREGGRYFVDASGTLWFFWRGKLLAVNSGGRDADAYTSLMNTLADIVPTTTGHRTVYAKIQAIAIAQARKTERPLWADMVDSGGDARIYIALDDEGQQVAAISADGVEVRENGDNADDVVVLGSRDSIRFDFDPDVDHEDLEGLFEELVGKYLATPPAFRDFILRWFSLLPFVDFVDSRPLLRFEGDAGSGKTFAAKLLSVAAFGRVSVISHGSTLASLYANAEDQGLIALDNIEARDLSEDQRNFFLTAFSKDERRRRTVGTESGITVKRPKCFILTTGIEPVAAEYEEFRERSFTVPFAKAEQGERFFESDVVAKIAARRDELLSMIYLRAASVIRAARRDGALATASRIIPRTIEQSRCSEALAVCYLSRALGMSPDLYEKTMTTFDPEVLAVLKVFDTRASGVARGASPIVATLSVLGATLHATEARDHLAATLGGKIIDGTTPAKWKLTIPSALLFMALKRVAKDAGLHFPFTNAEAFGKRLSAQGELVDQAGIELASKKTKKGRVFEIDFHADQGAGSFDPVVYWNLDDAREF